MLILILQLDDEDQSCLNAEVLCKHTRKLPRSPALDSSRIWGLAMSTAAADQASGNTGHKYLARKNEIKTNTHTHTQPILPSYQIGQSLKDQGSSEKVKGIDLCPGRVAVGFVTPLLRVLKSLVNLLIHQFQIW